ncbi:MAG: PKD domain-containing protein [Planctomycetaceae bacterium]|nr:PKD domain-containing protein [Planctomycetaceae bacterium]
MLIGLWLFGCATPEKASPARILHQSVDLDKGETQAVVLPDGTSSRLTLLGVVETADDVNGAVREAQALIDIDGRKVALFSGNYNLPVTLGGLQIDCPVTKGYLAKGNRKNIWGLLKDARLRIWPAGSPWIEPGSFAYPARQRWFATYTQMGNEPVYADGGDLPAKKEVYYHYGLDIGGCEGLVDVAAATDGLVVSSGTEVLDGPGKEPPVQPRYDVVYVLDARGWYYRYSHLKMIEPGIRPGVRVVLGQKIGVLGKEGGSGGWTHLHFDITRRQPSGLWGIEDGYAFLWQASQQERPRKVTAVARPHALIWTGQKVELDASKSHGKGLTYQWTFTEGGQSSQPRLDRVYEKPGTYCEILKAIDDSGNVDYDFKVVQVIDRANPEKPPPVIHAAYAPTLGIRPLDPVVFKVRTFRDTEGGETWDFGDGTPQVTVRSDANKDIHAANGYAETIHQYAKAGHYLVSVEHRSADGIRAVARLQVRVGGD